MRVHDLHRLKLQTCFGCPCLPYRPDNTFPEASGPGELIVQRLAVPMLIKDRIKPSILVAMDIFSRHVFHCCIREKLQCNDVARFLGHVERNLSSGIKAIFLSMDMVRPKTAWSYGAWTTVDICPEDFNALENFLGRAGAVLNAHMPYSQDDLTDRLDRYVQIYNQHIRQRSLGYRTPTQMIGLDVQGAEPKLSAKRRDTRSRIVKRTASNHRNSPSGSPPDV